MIINVTDDHPGSRIEVRTFTNAPVLIDCSPKQALVFAALLQEAATKAIFRNQLNQLMED